MTEVLKKLDAKIAQIYPIVIAIAIMLELSLIGICVKGVVNLFEPTEPLPRVIPVPPVKEVENPFTLVSPEDLWSLLSFETEEATKTEPLRKTELLRSMEQYRDSYTTPEPEPEPTPEPVPEAKPVVYYATVVPTTTSSIEPTIYASIEELAENCSLTVEDIITMVKTQYGEDRGNGMLEMSMVAWVILNRYDTGKFGVSVTAVCTAADQFQGYSANNPVTEICFKVVSDVIQRWEAEKAGATNVGRTIPADILFFYAKNGHHVFYKYTNFNQGEKVYFDRTQPPENPYA